MLFLVELDYVRSGQGASPEAGRAFIERIIFPTIARAERLMADGTIVSGGPVAGRVALRLMIEARSVEDADAIVSSLPLWTVADTRVTPLLGFSARRSHVQTLLEGLDIGR